MLTKATQIVQWSENRLEKGNMSHPLLAISTILSCGTSSVAYTDISNMSLGKSVGGGLLRRGHRRTRLWVLEEVF